MTRVKTEIKVELTPGMVGMWLATAHGGDVASALSIMSEIMDGDSDPMRSMNHSACIGRALVGDELTQSMLCEVMESTSGVV